MTNAADENEVVMYIRDEETGLLSYPINFFTGGFGGDSILQAPPDDPLASQDALIVSGNCLLAVNAGSNTVTSFKILIGEVSIEIASVVGSGGDIPVSIAANGDGLVYVLNAGGPGSISGFDLEVGCRLKLIPDSTVSLNQGPATSEGPPFFVSSPAQIGFNPPGEELIVTIKGIDGNPGSGGTINRFAVDASTGLVSDLIVFETGTDSIVPFSFDFDGEGNLLVVDAFGSSQPGAPDAGSVTVYNFGEAASAITVGANAVVSQTATCWIQYYNGCAYTTNNVSSSISSLEVKNGSVSLISSVAAELNNPIDERFSPDGRFLYVLSTGHRAEGQPSIYVYARGDNCGLAEIQVMADGIPNENVTVFGAVGLAVFGIV